MLSSFSGLTVLEIFNIDRLRMKAGSRLWARLGLKETFSLTRPKIQCLRLKSVNSSGPRGFKSWSFLNKAFTVINPKEPLGHYFEKFYEENNKSLIVAVSTRYSNDLKEFIETLSQRFTKLQVVGAAVDSIPLGCQRNGISFLFLDDLCQINDQRSLDDNSSSSSSSRPSHIRNGRTNWSIPDAFFSIDCKSLGFEAVVPLANTIFESGEHTTLITNFTQDNQSPQQHSISSLSSINMSLPAWNKSSDPCTPPSSSISHISSLISISEPLEITSFKDNMIKSLDHKPAASFLEASPLLMRPPRDPSHRRKVYAAIGNTRYEVQAGGGGSWSPRSRMLVLEPGAHMEQGMSVQFFLSTNIDPQEPNVWNEYQTQMKQLRAQISSSDLSLAFECAPILESDTDALQLVEFPSETVIEGLFGMGSEAGYLINDSKHSASGEATALLL